MSYEVIADTGLSSACFSYCPDTNFACIADTVGTAQADVQKGQAAGLSEGGIRALEDRLKGARAPFYAAAEACASQEPWRGGGKIHCGRIAAETTVRFSRGTITQTDRLHRPDGKTTKEA